MLNGVHAQRNKSLKKGCVPPKYWWKTWKGSKDWNYNPTTIRQALKYCKRLRCGILTGPGHALYTHSISVSFLWKTDHSKVRHLKLFLPVLLGMFSESQHPSFPSRSDTPCIMLAICLSKAPYFTLLHCWWECKLVQPLWRTVWRFLKKLKTELHMTLQFHSCASIWKKIWSERIHAPQCSL